MTGSTLIVEWSKNARSGSTQTDKTLTIGLGSRKKLNLFSPERALSEILLPVGLMAAIPLSALWHDYAVQEEISRSGMA